MQRYQLSLPSRLARPASSARKVLPWGGTASSGLALTQAADLLFIASALVQLR